MIVRKGRNILHLVLAGMGFVIPLAAMARGQDAPIKPLVLREDDAPKRVLPGLVKGSHVKVFIPSLPYLYTSHAINGALIKPSDNEQDWEYDMATAHSQIDATH